jgi:hypothetical protein
MGNRACLVKSGLVKIDLIKLAGATFILGAVGMAQAAIAQEMRPSMQSMAQPTETSAAQLTSQPVAQSATEPALVAHDHDTDHDTDHNTDDVKPLPTLPQAFNRAFYSHTGNYFDNRGIWQGFRLIFGIPNYVENSISQDGRAVNRLYKDALQQQISSGPILRSPDLPNPFTGSLLTTPLFITEQSAPLVPPASPLPSTRRPGYAEPIPVAPESSNQTAPQPRRTVPALW